MKKQATIICTALMIMGAFLIINWIPEVSALTLRVGKNQQYPTIAAALAAASPGDEIIIDYGIYTEQNVISISNLVIKGNPDQSRPIIKGTQSYAPIFDIDGKDITLQYLELDGTNSNAVSGVRSDVRVGEHTNIRMIDLKVHNLPTGIEVYRTNPQLSYPSAHEIRDCEVYHNSDGIYIEADPNPVFTGHMIYETSVHGHGYGYGIKVKGASNYIRNCDIYDNNVGVEFNEAFNSVIYDNGWIGYDMKIHDNELALLLKLSDDNSIYGDSTNDKLHIYENDDGIRLLGSQGNTFQYVDIRDNDGFPIEIDDHSSIQSNSNHIKNSDIVDNVCFNGQNHILIYDSNNNKIEDCVIASIDDISYIQMDNADNTKVINNEFDGTIYVDESDYVEITGTDCLSIVVYSSSDMTIEDCSISPGYGSGYSKYVCIFLYECTDIDILSVDLSTADYGFDITDCDDINIIGDSSTIDDVDVILYIDGGFTGIYWEDYTVEQYIGSDPKDIYVKENSHGTYKSITGYDTLAEEITSPSTWSEV